MPDMEQGNFVWPNDRNRVSNSDPASPASASSLYNCIRSNHIARIAQNLSRNHGPLTLGRAQEEGSRLIRNNLNSVINGLGPLMDPVRPREGGRLNLRSWIRRQQHQLGRNTVQNSIPTTSESTIVDFGHGRESHGQFPQANVFGPVQLHSQQYSYNSNHTSSSGDNGNNNHYVNVQIENNSSEDLNSNANNNHNNNTSTIAISTGSGTDNSQTEEITSDMQSIISLSRLYVPFGIILLGKAIYDHRTGILISLGLLATFTHADSVVKREIAKQSRRSLLSLFLLLINLFFCICFIFYVFQDQHLYKCLILIPPYSQPLSLWDLLWIVGITDFVLKFITIQIKAGMACFPASLLPYSARGKWYLFLECVSQLYRGLVPIQPWVYYLLEAYQGPEKVIGVFLSAAYMVSKGTELLTRAKYFKIAFWKLLQNVSLGVRPSKEQLDSAGPQCPICHDNFETPILLNCRHVFCESCVTTWFDRQQTCPLCRTKVADDPTWKDGATTFVAQIF